jgi:phosphatidylglycerophosphate synthase
VAPAVLAESRETGAPAVLVPPRGVARLWDDAVAGEPLGDGLARLLKDEEPAVVETGTWYLRVVGDADVRAGEARLRVGLGSAIDSRLDRAVHRRLSRPFTELAVRWGVTPNQISLASLGVGTLAAWCWWGATARWAVAGLALYLLSVVLDHADGEVARLTLAESRLGEWLDVLIDTIVHATIALALGATTAREAGPAGALLGAGAAVGFVASSALAKTAPGPADDDQVGAFLADLGARDGFYVMLLAFLAVLALRPALLLPLMILIAAGSHVYWLCRAGHRVLTR